MDAGLPTAGWEVVAEVKVTATATATATGSKLLVELTWSLSEMGQGAQMPTCTSGPWWELGK